MKGTGYVMSEVTMARARAIGLERQKRGEERRRRGDTHNLGDVDYEHSLRMNTEGAASEMVVARHLGLVYDPGPECDYAGDIVPGLQVRSTVHPHGRLIVYRGDPDDHVFVLVRGEMPRLRVVGWIFGGDCKCSQWWNAQARDPAFFVPGEALRDLPPGGPLNAGLFTPTALMA